MQRYLSEQRTVTHSPEVRRHAGSSVSTTTVVSTRNARCRARDHAQPSRNTACITSKSPVGKAHIAVAGHSCLRVDRKFPGSGGELTPLLGNARPSRIQECSTTAICAHDHPSRRSSPSRLHKLDGCFIVQIIRLCQTPVAHPAASLAPLSDVKPA